MAALSPEDRQKKEDKLAKKKEHQAMREEDMYNQVLIANNRRWLPKEHEIAVRKMIRKDVKELMKVEKMTKDHLSSDSSNSEDEDWERKIQNKVTYGSDSERDIDEYVLSKNTPFMHELQALEYDEEGEDEMEEGESENMEFVPESDPEIISPGLKSISSRRKTSSLEKEDEGQSDD